ncbi:prepilin peptidase [Candidatus Kaiserbacteria bacterium]|nr:prepilin peptidase [Candidatus Kaiserbacteria bacterium]
MEGIVFGVFGLIVGSFLNVLILRWGKRSLTGRSVCPSCGKQIAWYDNVPMLSWAILRGVCRYCSTPISPQYPLVEATMAALFVLIGLAPLPLIDRIAALPIAAILFAIAVYDLRTTYIPDAWTYVFIVLAFVTQLLTEFAYLDLGVLLLSGPAAAALLFALWLVSKGAWMGFGDVKLALGMGYLLGPLYGFFAVMLAFMIGAVVSLALLLPLPMIVRMLSRWGLARNSVAPSYTMKSEVPFGPFLVAATFIVWISTMHGFSFGLEQLVILP